MQKANNKILIFHIDDNQGHTLFLPLTLLRLVTRCFASSLPPWLFCCSKWQQFSSSFSILLRFFLQGLSFSSSVGFCPTTHMHSRSVVIGTAQPLQFANPASLVPGLQEIWTEPYKLLSCQNSQGLPPRLGEQLLFYIEPNSCAMCCPLRMSRLIPYRCRSYALFPDKPLYQPAFSKLIIRQNIWLLKSDLLELPFHLAWMNLCSGTGEKMRWKNLVGSQIRAGRSFINQSWAKQTRLGED